jgi:hypothetical protein
MYDTISPLDRTWFRTLNAPGWGKDKSVMTQQDLLQLAHVLHPCPYVVHSLLPLLFWAIEP